MPRRRSTAQAPEGALPGGEPAVSSDPADDRPERLAAQLGFRFKDLDLLRRALTHRSVVHDYIAAGGDPVQAAATTNERLEFLGDAVLGAIVAEYLYKLEPLADEGRLTQWRAALVRAESLVRWAREIELGAHLYLGHGEQPSSSSRDRMLASAFEALLGAIALDGGFAAARRFMTRFLRRDAPGLLVEAMTIDNPKGRLQEILLDRYKTPPTYRVTAASGPDHAREFTVAVSHSGVVLGTGAGTSTRDAEQRAAAAALATVATPIDRPEATTAGHGPTSEPDPHLAGGRA